MIVDLLSSPLTTLDEMRHFNEKVKNEKKKKKKFISLQHFSRDLLLLASTEIFMSFFSSKCQNRSRCRFILEFSSRLMELRRGEKERGCTFLIFFPFWTRIKLNTPLQHPPRFCQYNSHSSTFSELNRWHETFRERNKVGKTGMLSLDAHRVDDLPK